METWVWSLLSLVLSATVSAIITVVVKKAVEKRLDKNAAERAELSERHRQERKADVTQTIREELAPVTTELKDIKNQIVKISDGTLSSLRNDILTCYYKCNDKGYRNDYDYTNIYDLYNAYKALDGNSFVQDIMERFDKLPTKEAYRKELQKLKPKKTKTSDSKNTNKKQKIEY